jgi:hypothetical protein
MTEMFVRLHLAASSTPGSSSPSSSSSLRAAIHLLTPANVTALHAQLAYFQQHSTQVKKKKKKKKSQF